MITLIFDQGKTAQSRHHLYGIVSHGCLVADEPVEGIEINPFAVEMANKNAELNGVNAEFHVGSDRDVEDLSKYDTVIVDPPRAGLHPKLVRKILKDGPERVIYVSCNPKTLSENLSTLKERYRVESATGLDMFPHTPHIEAVTELRKV